MRPGAGVFIAVFAFAAGVALRDAADDGLHEGRKQALAAEEASCQSTRSETAYMVRLPGYPPEFARCAWVRKLDSEKKLRVVVD